VALEEAADILGSLPEERSAGAAAFHREQVVALKDSLKKLNASQNPQE
jgi:hypothetical protein